MNLVSEFQYLELPEISDSKFVKFDTWNNSTAVTVFWGNRISTIALHYLQTVFALMNDGLLCLVSEILSWEKNKKIKVFMFYLKNKQRCFQGNVSFFFAYTSYELHYVFLDSDGSKFDTKKDQRCIIILSSWLLALMVKLQW